MLYNHTWGRKEGIFLWFFIMLFCINSIKNAIFCFKKKCGKNFCCKRIKFYNKKIFWLCTFVFLPYIILILLGITFLLLGFNQIISPQWGGLFLKLLDWGFVALIPITFIFLFYKIKKIKELDEVKKKLIIEKNIQKWLMIINDSFFEKKMNLLKVKKSLPFIISIKNNDYFSENKTKQRFYTLEINRTLFYKNFKNYYKLTSHDIQKVLKEINFDKLCEYISLSPNFDFQKINTKNNFFKLYLFIY